MEVKAKVKKVLPVRSGEGRNGHYEIHPMIIEFEEQGNSGPITHALKVEFSAAKVKVEEIQKLCDTNQQIDLYLGFDVEQYKDVAMEKMKQYKTDDEKPVEDKNRLDDLRKQINENDDKRRDLYKEYGKNQKIVSQLFDLALLANNLLKGESLSKFVERSVDLLEK